MIRLNCFFQAGEGENNYKDALRAAVSLAEKSRKHPGCIAYDVFVSTSRSDVFMVCDTWKDKESHDQHAATPEYQRYCKIMNNCGHFKIEQFEFQVVKSLTY